MIPTTSRWVRTDLLHPKMVTRLEAFFADHRIDGNVKVVSGCRSWADQKRLYDRYRAGRGNLAANPDRRFGPGGRWRGSWHQQQEDGWCHAVDFRIVVAHVSTRTVNDVAVGYGLRPTVKGEWWHHQWRNAAMSEFPAPLLRDAESEKAPAEQTVDWAGIVAALYRQRVEVTWKPLRRGSRGDAVRTTQHRLGAHGFDPGRPDGVFGWRTGRAVKRFQRSRRLPVDGVVGIRTFDALLD